MCKYTILYKGLVHLQILVSKGVLEPIPHGYQGTTALMIIISRKKSHPDWFGLLG